MVASKVDCNLTEQPFLHMLQSIVIRQILKCLGKKLVYFNHCNFPVCPEENLFSFVSGQQGFCSSKSSHSTYFLILLIYFNKYMKTSATNHNDFKNGKKSNPK